jgi:hypothetical protein
MGGNVFGTTDKIKREDIKPTLLNFLKEFKRLFPQAEPHFRQMQTLGSVGKKEVSGDIDLAISDKSFDKIQDWGLDQQHVQELFELFKKRSRTASEEQLMKRAVIVAIAEKIQDADTDLAVDVKGSASGALFLQAPQYNKAGEQLDRNVQIDINVGDVDWLKFAYYSSVYAGNVKGLHRTQLLVALFANKGYIFSHNYGVKNRDTQEIEAKSPTEAIELLNKLYKADFTSEILENYFSVMEALKKNLSEQDLNKVYDIYLKILDSTRADIPEDLQDYWIANQERLQLKGKFLPDDSNLVKYKVQ